MLNISLSDVKEPLSAVTNEIGEVQWDLPPSFEILRNIVVNHHDKAEFIVWLAVLVQALI